MALSFEESLHIGHLFTLGIQGSQNGNGSFPNHLIRLAVFGTQTLDFGL
jgi:hypothetical protein